MVGSAFNLSDSIYALGSGTYAFQVASAARDFSKDLGLLNSLEPMQLGLQLHGRLEINASPLQVSDIERLTPSLQANVSQDYPEPVIVAGKPKVPRFVTRVPWDIQASQAVGHISAGTDPDPIWVPGSPGHWAVAPPAGGAGDYWWRSRSLPDPTTLTGFTTAQLAGGTLTPGTYHYEVAPWDYQKPTLAAITSQTSEYTPSQPVAVTLASGAGGTVSLTWPAMPGATGYTVYRLVGASYAAIGAVAQVPGSSTAGFQDDGTTTPTYPPLTGATSTTITGFLALGAWASDAPSTAQTWNSTGLYRPYVRPYLSQGAGGINTRYKTTVSTSSDAVEHMWTSITGLQMPFTAVIVAIVKDIPPGNSACHLLDSGDNPVTGGYSGGDPAAEAIAITENFGYRNLLQVTSERVIIGSDASLVNRISAPFLHNHKMQMFFGIWNGAASRVGAWSPAGKYDQIGTLVNKGVVPKLVLGRANSVLWRNQGSSLAIREIRLWKSALTQAQLLAQYQQLQTTHKFTAL